MLQGKKYGATRDHCDNNFKTNMVRICNQPTKRILFTTDLQVTACKSTAQAYYEAVHLGT